MHTTRRAIAKFPSTAWRRCTAAFVTGLLRTTLRPMTQRYTSRSAHPLQWISLMCVSYSFAAFGDASAGNIYAQCMVTPCMRAHLGWTACVWSAMGCTIRPWICFELVFCLHRKPHIFLLAWRKNLPANQYLCALSAASSLRVQLILKVTSAVPSMLHDWN